MRGISDGISGVISVLTLEKKFLVELINSRTKRLEGFLIKLMKIKKWIPEEIEESIIWNFKQILEYIFGQNNGNYIQQFKH